MHSDYVLLVYSSANMSVSQQPPLGFFDPLNLAADCDAERFERLRYVEIKHGRIAMLAVAGYLLTAGGGRLPGLISYDGTKFSDIPAGFAALDKVPAVWTYPDCVLHWYP